VLPAAVVLHARVGEGPGRARSLVRADLRVLAGLLVIATGAVLSAGTVVTGTGPLAGTMIDKNGHLTTVPRYHLSLVGVTEFHADLAWFICALALALLIGLQFAPGTPRRCVTHSRVVLGWIVVQAVIGYVQYFNHLPAGLVWVHVASATGLWVAVLRLSLSTRERAEVPVPGTAELDAAGLDPAGQASSRLRREQGAIRRPAPMTAGTAASATALPVMIRKDCPSSVSSTRRTIATTDRHHRIHPGRAGCRRRRHTATAVVCVGRRQSDRSGTRAARCCNRVCWNNDKHAAQGVTLTSARDREPVRAPVSVSIPLRASPRRSRRPGPSARG
jgi:hypothetical protein